MTAQRRTYDGSGTKPDVQVANWCFTLNNYSLEEFEYMANLFNKDPRICYIIFGKEVGETGTPHLQGYIEFKRTVKFGGVRLLLPRCHIEPRRARTNGPAIEYCKKDGSFFEMGIPKVETQKKDYEGALAKAKEDKVFFYFNFDLIK